MASEQQPYYVLGLNPGIASCGFALLDMNNHTICEMGSHLFKAPQGGEKRTSLAAVRRNARSARRKNERTKNRQKHCMKLLQASGLVPSDADKQWFQTQKGDKPPLDLRVAGLDRALNNREWAQVLYSLSGRRGYIPHGVGKESEVDDVEEGEVLKAIAQNRKEMEEANYRTVGEMLKAKNRSRNRQGDYSLCVAHSQLVDEVKVLFAKQRSVGNSHADEAFEQDYINCINWEKETIEYDERTYECVGFCSYFPNEKRAARADLSSEYLQAIESLSLLEIIDSDGVKTRLSAEQRSKYLQILFSAKKLPNNKECKVRYSDIRKDFGITQDCSFKGINTEDEKKMEPYVPKVWRSMRKNGLPTSLMERMLDDREIADAIGEALCYASTENSLRNKLDVLDLSDEEINTLLELPFNNKLFKGYGSRSLKAIYYLLDSFESPEIQTLSDAEEASGLMALRLTDTGLRGSSLPPFDLFDPTCKNPVVLRAMGRMRHIVNSIIKLHGMPDEIRIELDRELKIPKKAQKKIAKENKLNRNDKARIAARIGEFLHIAPEDVPGKLVRKYQLWEEQGGFDAYTGAIIEHDRLINEEKYCSVDHILPYSRTCDDSRHNKVLVLAQSKQSKHERTPFEWMAQDSDKAGTPSWDEFKDRTLAANYSYQKKVKMLNTNLGKKEEQRIIEHSVNDTRYMSRLICSFFAKSLDFKDNRKRHVFATVGGTTTNLCYAWGLGSKQMKSRVRNDARHLAIDAAVIAACSSKYVIAIARAHERKQYVEKKEYERLLKDSLPWPGFAQAVISASEQVIPTRMIDHGVTGRAFEDTLYRLEGIDFEKGKLALLSKKVNNPEKKTTLRRGNYVVTEDGITTKLIDGIAFLRLWLDPGIQSNGSDGGQYYVEPVYYADIPAMKNGTYVPKACTIQRARASWPPVPESALQGQPIILRQGDVLMVDDKIGRYWGFNISVRKWEIQDLRTGEACAFPTIGSLGVDNCVRVIQEDTLGHCYDFLRPLPKEPRCSIDAPK